jgi:hypothetical protein
MNEEIKNQEEGISPEELFKKNLEAFKLYHKDIYEQFKDYKPEKAIVKIEPFGITIYDTEKEAYLYPGDARLIISKQLAHFLADPSYSSVGYNVIQATEDWIHVRYINKLVRLAQEIFKNKQITIDGKILPTLIISGVGIGFHINFLLKNFDVYNVLIFEPNKDFFFISMHFIDWEKILSKFAENPKKRMFIIVGEKEDYKPLLRGIFHEIGVYFTASAFHYIHYRSNEMNKYLKDLERILTSELLGVGFFDDEIISLQHTLVNLKNRVPIFVPRENKNIKNVPAVVVGSGPSLNYFLPLLKKHQNKVYVIACGTASRVLEKHGIKADLHVNIERNATPYIALIKGTSEQYRQETPFMGANNNYPPFFQAFKQSAMYLKAGDAGSSLFPSKYPHLYYVNPTVTNTGLALAYYLGFREVYLLGVDLGFPEEKFHAEGTIYEVDKNLAKDMESVYSFSGELEGNWGGKVKTSFILRWAWVVFEDSMRYFTSMDENFKVYNPNFGAKIDKTIRISKEELEEKFNSLKEIDKKQINREIWKNEIVKDYDLQEFELTKRKMQLMTNFHHFKNVLKEEISKINNTEDFLQFAIELGLMLQILARENKILQTMIFGSLSLFMAYILRGLYTDVPLKERQRFLQLAKDLLNEFLEEMEKKLLELYPYFPLV